MQQQKAIEFIFIEKASSLWGFHWLIEWSTSSFYIKCLQPGMQMAKVSLHGPDPKHPGQQHLRFALDKPELVDKATKAGGRWYGGSETLPFHFSGRQVRGDAAHIVRFSAEWDTFIKGAPGPGKSKGPRQKSTFRALVPAPAKDKVAQVDIYLSMGKPYWPDEPGIRAADAGMGPITNAIGMHLTAVSNHRSITSQPDPHGDIRGDAPLDQCSRSLAAAVDETGLLWLCEKVVPLSRFDPPATN